MREAVFQVMDSWGSIGIFLLILIENLFPPIPSEVILTFGGFMTTYTAMTAGEAIAAATAGSVAGARGSLWSRTPGHAQPSGTLPGRQSGNASPFSEGGCGRRGRMV